jgi:hypothetical protein
MLDFCLCGEGWVHKAGCWFEGRCTGCWMLKEHTLRQLCQLEKLTMFNLLGQPFGKLLCP